MSTMTPPPAPAMPDRRPLSVTPLDWAKGDEYTYQFERSLLLARRRFGYRRCRQQVRRLQSPNRKSAVWLVQDVR